MMGMDIGREAWKAAWTPRSPRYPPPISSQHESQHGTGSSTPWKSRVTGNTTESTHSLEQAAAAINKTSLAGLLFRYAVHLRRGMVVGSVVCDHSLRASRDTYLKIGTILTTPTGRPLPIGDTESQPFVSSIWSDRWSTIDDMDAQTWTDYQQRVLATSA